MLDAERNRIITQVGPGTPMGDLLRRYWHPIGAASEMQTRPTKPIRLLGEDLVLYKDLSGRYGLIDRHCPHRRADLSYGFVEQCGLRCNYHGWLMDHEGRCIEQPFEETLTPGGVGKARIRTAAYPVEEKAGLLWAYMGPQPAPLVPNYEPFLWPHGFRQIVFSELECNWFQCQENSIDPVHFEWMHDNWSVRLKGSEGPYAPRHLKVDFEEFDWGIAYRRLREGNSETSELWTVGRVCLWPYALFTGSHFEWRVPIDDTRTLSVCWFFSRVPKEREPYVQESIPAWNSPVMDPATGRAITTHIMNQDFVGWIGQGTIADRTREHLGASDRGIVMMRRRFFADLEAIREGREPKAIVRDPAVNRCIELPVVDKQQFTEGVPLEQIANSPQARRSPLGGEFRWLYGQPAEVNQAWREAMGLP